MTPEQTSDILTVCVVSHTHWDREWYHDAARFRQRLVALVDGLLANATGVTAPFLLDGQAIVLEDYLSVRPERVAQLAEQLRNGAIEAGPWYVLGDGLIPSGEAMVRNLLAGRQVLRQFGADVVAPAVAYCPDTFGHASAIPTIAQGFGFPIAIIWRGYGSARVPRGDTARWQSEDGAEVLLYHLPPDGYETGSALPSDDEQIRVRWNELYRVLGSRSSTGVVLLPNGADHHALQPDLGAALSALTRVARPHVIVRESLGAFARRVVQRAQACDLPLVTGELRDSYGYTWTLGGTYATRAAQKRANARAERDLLRDVEPWLVLAWLHGRGEIDAIAADSRITFAQVPALLAVAWRTLLRAHPHDTLCGCSIDAVARAMDEHVASARSQARGLRAVAVEIALHHDVVVARSGPLSVAPVVVVRNRVARWRGGVAEVLLDETLADVPVGPSSGVSDATIEGEVGRSVVVTMPIVEDLIVQVLNARLAYRRRESPQHYPDNDLVREHRALVWMPAVPPLGLAVRPIGFRSVGENKVPGALNAIKVPGALNAIKVPGALNAVNERAPEHRFEPAAGEHTSTAVELANGLLTVTLTREGVRIRHDERVLSNVLTFETSRDVGDSYTPAIRGKPEYLRIVRVQLGARGPLRASARVWLRTEGKRNAVRIVATLSLDVDSDTLHVDIRGNNQRRNHRLRVNFNTDVVASGGAHSENDVWADAAFGPVRRPPLNIPAHDQLSETVPPTMPMHRWATLSSAERGATLHSDGLAEVEANRESGLIALTLIRAVGELSRNDLPERPGHAGWPAEIPQAQALGPFRAKIGLQLHGTWSQAARDAIEDANEALLLPLTGTTMRDLARPPHEVLGPQLDGVGLRQSATTLAQDGDGIVLRCVNDSYETRTGHWRLPDSGALQFATARLDETLTGAWQPICDSLEFTAPPRAVVTLRVRRLAL